MQNITNQQELIGLLQKHHISEYFSNYEHFLPLFRAIRMDRKDFLLTYQNAADFIYFYVEGKFKVYNELANGQRKLMRYCEPPMLMGEMELILGRDDATLCTEAIEPGLIIALDYRLIREDLLNDVRFLNAMCNSFAEKFSVFGNAQTRNTMQSADAKLASYLLQYADADGIFHRNLRNVAEELEISYRHLHRVLDKFIQSGWVERENHNYHLLNRRELKMLTEEELQ